MARVTVVSGAGMIAGFTRGNGIVMATGAATDHMTVVYRTIGNRRPGRFPV